MTTKPLPAPREGFYYPWHFQEVINAIRHRGNTKNGRHEGKGSTATTSIDTGNDNQDSTAAKAKRRGADGTKKAKIVAEVD